MDAKIMNIGLLWNCFDFFLEYAELERDGVYSEKEWELIEDAKDKQNTIEHVRPVGIVTENEEYIQFIWCLRQTQIQNIRKSKLGTIKDGKYAYDQQQKNQFLRLMTILENGVRETNAIDEKMCGDLLARDIDPRRDFKA